MGGAFWDDVGSYCSSLEMTSEADLLDKASKARLLQSVCSFLSCLRTTSLGEEVSLSSSKVCTRHAEVAQLHEMLFRELKKQIHFILSPCCRNSNPVKHADESADSIVSRTLDLQIISLTLRCCIKVLPPMDCFDKSAGLSSAKTLDGIVRQLCSPSTLLSFVGLPSLNGVNLGEDGLTGLGPHTLHMDHNERFQGAEHHSCKQSWSYFADGGPVRRGGVSDPPAMSDSRDEIEVILAMLEVYIDELLLHPDLGARLLSSRGERQEHVTSGFGHAKVPLEAALAHALLFHHAKRAAQASGTAGRERFLVCNLTLPAGLILLEIFKGQDVPSFYIEHVVRLVAGMLNDTTTLNFDQMNKLRATQSVARVPLAGGVDWSYCSLERLPNCDRQDWCINTKVLSLEDSLDFASSIFEHAILLYTRTSLSSEQCSTSPYTGSGSSLQWRMQIPVLRLCLSKYESLCSMLNETFELDVVGMLAQREDPGIEQVVCNRSNGQCCSKCLKNFSDLSFKVRTNDVDMSLSTHDVLGASTGSHYLFMAHEDSSVTKEISSIGFKKEGSDEVLSLGSALLHLMSCAVKCMGREICKLWLLCAVGHRFASMQEISEIKFSDKDYEKVLHYLSLNLGFCIHLDSSLHTKCGVPQCTPVGRGSLSSESVIGGGLRPLNQLVGHVIIFFTNVLRQKVQKGAPDTVLEEHFHLLESLVALLLSVGKRNDRTFPDAGFNSECNCMPSGTSGGVSQVADDSEQCRRCHPHEECLEHLPLGSNATSFLEVMVLSLQGMLEDLSKHQRSMPGFLLSFVFKQLSRGDALNLVAMALSSYLENHSDVQHILNQSGVVFQSGGLVTQLLHMALSKPTRSRSLLTFISHIVNILHDLPPITATLLSSEGNESMFWFEKIAHTLTLACQFAFKEQGLFVRNDHRQFISPISKLCEGIERLIMDGTVVALWLSDAKERIVESARQHLTGSCEPVAASTITGQTLWKETLTWENLEKFNGFLTQVDMLRKAVEILANSGESLLHEEFTPFLLKGKTFSTALSDLLACEMAVSGKLVTTEKEIMSPAIALVEQIVDMEAIGVDLPKSPAERQSCSSKTSAIIKRLLQRHRSRKNSSGSVQVSKKRGKASRQEIITCYQSTDKISNVGISAMPDSMNSYLDLERKLDPGKDNYDDLKDFIVSKPGRDYCTWLLRREKYRRRLCNRNLLKRSQERRELLLLLGM